MREPLAEPSTFEMAKFAARANVVPRRKMAYGRQLTPNNPNLISAALDYKYRRLPDVVEDAFGFPAAAEAGGSNGRLQVVGDVEERDGGAVDRLQDSSGRRRRRRGKAGSISAEFSVFRRDKHDRRRRPGRLAFHGGGLRTVPCGIVQQRYGGVHRHKLTIVHNNTSAIKKSSLKSIMKSTNVVLPGDKSTATTTDK